MDEIEHKPDDVATLAAIGSLAYACADIAHHALGHAAACLGLGGQIDSLTSIHVACTLTGEHIDVAGPMANLAVGVVCWRAAKALADHPWPRLRLFLILAAAFNLFWLEAQLVFSAASRQDDWELVLQALHPTAAWRIGAMVSGAGAYLLTVLVISRLLRPFGDRVRRIGVVAYLAAGAAACLTALPDPQGWPAILRHAAPQSFGAALGLLFLRRGGSTTPEAGRAAPIRFSLGWVIAAGVVLALSIAILGRGIEVP